MATSMMDREIRVGLDKPSNNFLYGASIVSIVLSLLTVRRNPGLANFFGLWAPTILGLGILMKENQLLEMNKRLMA
ncbi:MAG TPA: hypothetical protein V6C52_06850 [Coleofasciculaceae cyanobacterium]|jgi:hypothetical protein